MNSIQLITAQALKKIIDVNKDLYLIDVRENDEWAAGHIHAAIHIPLCQLTENINAYCPDKTQPIYLHCKGGVRSLKAAELLAQLGYTKLYSVEGGFLAWLELTTHQEQ